MKKKYSQLQIMLTVTFVCCLLISNIIAARQVQLPFGITAGGAILIFPITYALSDIFSEVYGYEWSRKTCYMAFLMNTLMIIVFQLLLLTPYPGYWENENAFSIVLSNTPRAFIGSAIGMLMGDYANDVVFEAMKKTHKKSSKGFKVRAITSSFVGEIVDSLFFIPITFYGTMPINEMAIMLATGAITKTGYEIIIIPITDKIRKKVEKYENS